MIGAALVAVGGWVTGGLATGFVAGVIGGALVGAAIGGLTAAITGGDIGQGILFGAIGGAVTGGVASWGAGAGGLASGGQAAAGWGGAAGEALATGQTVTGLSTGAGTFTGSAVAGAGATQTIGSTLSTVGGNLFKEYGGDLVMGVAGAYMDGKNMDDDREHALKMMQQGHKNNMEELNARLAADQGGGGGSEAPADHSIELKKMDIAQRQKEMAEATRKYELDRSDRLAVEEEVLARRSGRQALFQGRSSRGATADTPAQQQGTGIQAARQENQQALAIPPVASAQASAAGAAPVMQPGQQVKEEEKI